VAFSPDGKTAASGGGYGDNVIRLWGHGHRARAALLRGAHPIHNSITGLAFTPDGKHLLSCALDMTVRLWDVATGAEVRQFRGHQAGVTGLALAPDGKTLATASQDRHRAPLGRRQPAPNSTRWRTPPIVHGVAFLRRQDARRAVDDGSIHLYDPATGKS